MHVQTITFGLGGVSEEQYITDCHAVTPAVAATPGLLATMWLEDPENGRYGAIYFWEDGEAMERGRIWSHPDAVDVQIDDYGVLERLTRATQPVLTIVE